MHALKVSAAHEFETHTVSRNVRDIVSHKNAGWSVHETQSPATQNTSWLKLGTVRIRIDKSMDQLGLKLSPREQEILLLTAQGEGVKSIARLLDISVHTVDTFRRRIYQKLGVSNAASAAAITLALCLGAEVRTIEPV